MILSRLAHPRWPRAIAGLLAAVALLTACGGGTSQYEPFVAQRVFAFGDETSTLTSAPAGNGRKYSVNGLDDDGNVDCRLHPLWVQSVALNYGFVFDECNRDAIEPKAFMFAAEGATAAGVAARSRPLRSSPAGSATATWPPCWRAPTTSSRSTSAIPPRPGTRCLPRRVCAANAWPTP